jgi:hypothetical protein
VVTSHSYWRAWVEVQSSLGRVRVKQEREKKGNSYGERGQVLHADFWAVKRELSAGKSTIHVLEGNHCWAVVMLENSHVCLQNGL